MEEELDPLSSEAMFEKHKAAVEVQHKSLKKKKKKKKEEDEIIFHKGKFKVCYEWGEEDTLSNQKEVKDPQ